MRFRPLVLFAAALLLLAGCTKRETPAEAGIRTQTLLLGNAAEPGDLDPQVASVLNDQIIVLALFEGLTWLDEQTTLPVPAAAERWETSPAGLRWTFHLRAGLQWPTGESWWPELRAAGTPPAAACRRSSSARSKARRWRRPTSAPASSTPPSRCRWRRSRAGASATPRNYGSIRCSRSTSCAST